MLRPAETPRRLSEFGTVLCLLVSGGVVVLWSQGRVPQVGAMAALGLLGLLLVLAWVWPGCMRPAYRVAMRFGEMMGGLVGTVLLSLLFLLVVTPMGWVLRLLGKDLLDARWKRGSGSMWRPVKRQPDLRRMF